MGRVGDARGPDLTVPEARDRRRGGLVWGVATAATLVALLARNTYLFTTKVYADGDFAANAILIDKALRWQLLSGNYSRIGFRHPGPGFLYVEAWSEWLFHDVLGLVPTAFNAHVVGVLVLNALLLGAFARVLHAHSGAIVATMSGFTAAAAFLAAQPYALSFVWMPYVYVAPFLLFTAAVASFAAGRWASLPWVVLSGGLLVHGHVSFLGFVVPAVVVIAAVAWWRERRVPGAMQRIRVAHARLLVVSLAISAVFLLPIVINVAWNFPADFGRYLDYVQSGQAGQHSLAAVMRYGLDYWGTGLGRHITAIVLLGGATALALSDPRAEQRRFGLSAVATALGLSVLFLNYGLRGIDNLEERYIGQFYVAVPAFVLGVVGMHAAARLVDAGSSWRESGRRIVAGTVALVAVVACTATAASAGALTHPYRGDPRIPALHETLHDAPDREGAPVVMSFSTATWPLPTGLMYYGAHHGLRVCAADELWEFLVTSEFVCSTSERRRGWLLDVSVPGDAPDDPIVHQDDRVVITARRRT